ncbi:hypothetical protein L5I01_25900 [Gordonia sp. HY442]|uniref:hypothetical protein n=1 Tax=Gordonia zhenghanii TaxID=2911516 RepID=UPI001F31196A|nr:hypothetical protein [Gordonia zhenghanii]MCF8606792.1 hypothetical protein [Gordonia zhenghanii]
MTKNDDGREWAEELVRRAGRAARQARGKRSAKWLSDETAALGMRISPTVIAKLDSGHRGANLSVPELLVLAAALNVPPAALMFPDMPDGEVRRYPTDEPWNSFGAYNWVSGAEAELRLDPTPPGRSHKSAWDAKRLIDLSYMISEGREGLAEVESQLASAARKGSAEELESARKKLQSMRRTVAQTIASIKDLGGTVNEDGSDG